jgi:Protein of unknown function (DUF3352)
MTDQPNPAAPPPGSDPPAGLPGDGPGPAEPTPTETPAEPTPTPTWAQPTPTPAEPTPAEPTPMPTPTPPWAQQGPTWAEPGLPAVEPADETAPAQTVAREAGEAGTSRKSTGVRWAIAIGGIAIVVGITIAIFALTSGSRPTPSIAVGYMPNDTVQYGEYRLDLPGDQRQKLAAYLSKLPGFADQAAIQPKLNEVFDRIVAAASSNSQTFTADIQPWFGGQIGIGSGPPNLSPVTGDAQTMTPVMSGLGSQLVVVTITDPAKAKAWVEKTIGTKATATEYGGATLYSADGLAAAVTDKVLIGGSETAVKAAIDTKGQGNLASNPQFKAAFSSVSRDYVAFGFVDYRSAVTSVVDLAAPSAGLQRSLTDTFLGFIPAWLATDARFEDDALVAETAFPSVDIGFSAKNRASTLSSHVPASTLFYAESHDLGAALTAFLNKLRAIPELRSTFGQIDQSAGLIGGLDGLFGWWGDSAVVIGPNPDGSIGGGVLIAPTDAAAARKTFATLRSFIVLGGGQAGITLRDETHGDATVTIVDFSGAMAASGGVPPGVKAEIAYTVTDNIVVVGYGAAFVDAVLDAGPGKSLADDARFKSLVGRVGAENLGLTFVDVQAIRTLAEPLVKPLVSAEEWATYQREIVPYVSHLDALISSSKLDGGINRLPMSFTVK